MVPQAGFEPAKARFLRPLGVPDFHQPPGQIVWGESGNRTLVFCFTDRCVTTTLLTPLKYRYLRGVLMSTADTLRLSRQHHTM
jgi:hypothetical protein